MDGKIFNGQQTATVGQVQFPTVKSVYASDEPVYCYFSVPAAVGGEFAPESGDWIGIFKVGWSSLGECQYKVPVSGEMYGAGSGVGSVIFDAAYLPKDYDNFYQFVYVKAGEQIRGASTPFKFEMLDETPIGLNMLMGTPKPTYTMPGSFAPGQFTPVQFTPGQFTPGQFTPPGQVGFQFIRSTYPIDKKLTCYFNVLSGPNMPGGVYKPQIGDWIGIFKLGWTDMADAIYKKEFFRTESSFNPDNGLGHIVFESFPQTHSMDTYYQFVYVKSGPSGESVVGTSKPFLFVDYGLFSPQEKAYQYEEYENQNKQIKKYLASFGTTGTGIGTDDWITVKSKLVQPPSWIESRKGNKASKLPKLPEPVSLPSGDYIEPYQYQVEQPLKRLNATDFDEMINRVREIKYWMRNELFTNGSITPEKRMHIQRLKAIIEQTNLSELPGVLPSIIAELRQYAPTLAKQSTQKLTAHLLHFLESKTAPTTPFGGAPIEHDKFQKLIAELTHGIAATSTSVGLGSDVHTALAAQQQLHKYIVELQRLWAQHKQMSAYTHVGSMQNYLALLQAIQKVLIGLGELHMGLPMSSWTSATDKALVQALLKKQLYLFEQAHAIKTKMPGEQQQMVTAALRKLAKQLIIDFERYQAGSVSVKPAVFEELKKQVQAIGKFVKQSLYPNTAGQLEKMVRELVLLIAANPSMPQTPYYYSLKQQIEEILELVQFYVQCVFKPTTGISGNIGSIYGGNFFSTPGYVNELMAATPFKAVDDIYGSLPYSPYEQQ